MLEVQVRRGLPGFELDVGFRAGDEITVLFGPSGSGKSLTLQCLAGIIRPDGGRIVAGGRVLFDRSAGVNVPSQRRRVGYVPQNYALFPHLTVSGNIAFGLRKMTTGEREARVREMVEMTALEGFEKRRPRELSGGQQQRVALARALAVRPDVLLLDEPFSSLDSSIRSELREQLLDLQRRTHVTTIVVTHDLEDAFLLGHRMAVMDGGRVLQEGTREDIFYRPAARRVAEFVRTRNVLSGRVAGAGDDALRIEWRGHEIEAPPCDLAPDTAVDVCIRPTQIMIARSDRPQAERRQNAFCGRIVAESIQAETYRLFVKLAAPSTPDRERAGDHVAEVGRGTDDLLVDYDLEIELPGYVYFRLGLDRQKEISVSIRREAVHVIPEGTRST